MRPLHLLILGLALLKGTLMATLLHVMSVDFVQSVVVACVSATLSGIFLLIGIFLTYRMNENAKARGVKRREDDNVIL